MLLDPQNDYPTTSDTMFSSETVTLTKAQLKAILEAVGQVGALHLSEGTSIPPSQHGSSSPEPGYFSVHEKSAASLLNNDSSLDENLNGFQSADAEIGMSSSLLSLSSSSHNASLSSNNASPSSKVKQKRLQWEKEKAEADNWDPWGRPGGGAPRSNRRSVVMASVSPSTSRDSLKNQSRAYSGCSYLTSASFPSSTAYGQRVPDFLKSSLPFGPNCDEPDNDQLEKKRQWLSELEQQREDQRKSFGQSSDPYDGDRWGYEETDDSQQTSAGPHSGMNTPLSTDTSRSRSYHRGQSSLDPDKAMHLQEQRERAVEYRRLIEEQVEEKRRKQQQERDKLKREEELEELRLEQERERLKAQYDQEQKQIKDKEEREEQKRLMMAAAVQKAREEAEAEKKAKKAQRLNNQTAKSPLATPCRQVPPASRLSLREETTQSLIVNEGGVMPSGNSSASTSPKHLLEKGGKEQPQQTARVIPVQSSPTHNSESNDTTDFEPAKSSLVTEMSCQTEQPLKLPPEPTAYVANRLLTPSVWRTRERRAATQNAWGHHRDMATQTEQLFWGDEHVRHEHPSYSADDRSSRNSSATSKRSCTEKGGYKSDTGTRPVWGANQPVKSFVKMTDRDPNHYRRKKFQEMRRQHWEREMASLRDQIAQTRSRSRGSTSQSVVAGPSTAKGTTATAKTTGTVPRLSRGRVTSDSAFPVRRRAVSDGQSAKRSERDSAWSSAGSSIYTMSANSLGTTYTISSGHLPTLSRRWSNSSDHIPPSSETPHLAGGASHPENFDRSLMVSDEQDMSYFPPVRRKWRSHESVSDAIQQTQEPRPQSPSNLKEGKGRSRSCDDPSLLPPPPAPRRKWSEQGNFDPAAVALGYSDSEKGTPDTDKLLEPDPSQDPLVNPKVVTSRPTPRQDRILQQLSTLRQGLLQKQREIEILLRHPSSWPS